MRRPQGIGDTGRDVDGYRYIFRPSPKRELGIRGIIFVIIIRNILDVAFAGAIAAWILIFRLHQVGHSFINSAFIVDRSIHPI